MISIRVLGTPKAQPRPRAGLRKVFTAAGPKMVVRAYDPSTAEGWKSEIARAAEDARPREPLEGPIRLELVLLFPRPKALTKTRSPRGRLRHAVKPDRDNCEKAVLDVLQAAGFFANDAQILRRRGFEVLLRRRRAPRGGDQDRRVRGDRRHE